MHNYPQMTRSGDRSDGIGVEAENEREKREGERLTEITSGLFALTSSFSGRYKIPDFLVSRYQFHLRQLFLLD